MDTLNPWVQVTISVFSAVLASSGLWAFIQKRFDRKFEEQQKDDEGRQAERAMLRGLAHDRIMYLGMQYINKGWCTQDEYENLEIYLFEPYEKLGSNGSATKVMEEVRKLPLRKPDDILA